MKALQIVLLFAQNMTILDLPSLLQVQSYPSLDNQSFSLYAKEYVMLCFIRSKIRDSCEFLWHFIIYCQCVFKPLLRNSL